MRGAGRRCRGRTRADRRQPGSSRCQRRVVDHRRRRRRGRDRARRGDVVLPSCAARRRFAVATAGRRRAHEGARHRRRPSATRGWGSRTSVSFSDAVDIEDDHGDGRPARGARRDPRRHAGRVLARRHHAHRQSIGRLRARGRRFFGSSRSARASSSRLPPAMRPTAQSRTPIARKATSIGLEAIKKSFGIDASGYELEVIERSFPAGKTEMTWRSPALKYGHVEQLQVNLQGDTPDPDRAIAAAAARLQIAANADGDADFPRDRTGGARGACS